MTLVIVMLTMMIMLKVTIVIITLYSPPCIGAFLMIASLRQRSL